MFIYLLFVTEWQICIINSSTWYTKRIADQLHSLFEFHVWLQVRKSAESGNLNIENESLEISDSQDI